MSFHPVTSREYKLMLRPAPFRGDEETLIDAARTFWSDYVEMLGDLVLSEEGTLETVKHRRDIRFFDTVDHQLNRSDYAFRERIERGGDHDGRREATLKFRHQDRYIARGRDLDPADDDRAETKFEEDIKPPFLKLFSYSTKQRIDDDVPLATLGDVARLFPGLENDLDGYDDAKPLAVVGGFTAHEVVIGGGELRLGRDPGEEAECALVVWYGEHAEDPAVAEFSYKYADDHEDYGKKVAARAFDAFAMVQRLEDWVDPDSLTKTRFVYSR
jgi:hypothetical protein